MQKGVFTMDLFIGFVLTALTGICGYLFGILKERRDLKWRENRAALQCAYAYFDILCVYIKENEPMPKTLLDILKELKYYKNFNIVNKTTFKKVRKLIEYRVYNEFNQSYNSNVKSDFVKEAEEFLPILKNEIEYTLFKLK